MKTVWPFTTPAPPGLSQAGGKALSLILMTREGLPVPPGFVLTVDFFQPWLDEVKRSSEWLQFLESPADRLKHRCNAVKAVCADLHLTTAQEMEMQQALARFKSTPSELIMAVRSSSPEEDLEGTSFAGGYETTLGVTVDSLEAAIRRSFASVFDERIMTYKHRNGLRLQRRLASSY